MDNSILIKPSKGWVFVDIKEIWQYKDLLYFLTIRGIKAKYAQSVLGIGWAIVQPLVTMLVYTIVFGSIAKINSGGIPYAIFAFLGLWPWNYFSGTLTESANSLITNSGMITKVYFPRLILPLASIFSKFLDFVVAFIIIIALLVYYRIMPGAAVVWLPLLTIQLLLTSLGVGMLLSAMAVQYRDVKHALTFMVQILMYAAPVVYSTNAVSQRYQFLYTFNPMVGVIEGYRAAFLGNEMPWHWIWPGCITAVLFFTIGTLYFKKMERVFADVA
jgi:lipopolysaccharide transport system permease protein